jgi:hypothetical protein
MSLLDTASLIVTPNGYKDGKLYSVIPSDGSGDLSVTRATTATRVNSAGLVELVPYNLLPYSQDFSNAAWIKSNAPTMTYNSAIAPDGTMTATGTQDTTGGNYKSVYQTLNNISPNSTFTYSIFVKKETSETAFGGFSMYFFGGTAKVVYGIVNAVNGTVTIASSSITPIIQVISEGNYWRIICTATDTGSNTSLLVEYYQTISTDGTTLAVGIGSVRTIWGAQLVEGSTAKDYQKTETRLNIPRLDYSNGTCPSLLVEPQRTNLALYSSSFDTSPWIAVGTTITPNTQVAPDGTTTGDTYNTSQSILLLQTISASPSTTYTLSLWVKLGTATNLCLIANNTAAWNTIGGQSFDSSDGLNTSTWTRIEWTFTTPASLPAGAINIHLGGNSETGLTQSTGSVHIWGAQLEAGNYSTSYIPTTSASVTRNADVISKTGISSLIGQTEGTIFMDFTLLPNNSNNSYLFSISDGSTNNIIRSEIYVDSPSIYQFRTGIATLGVSQGDAFTNITQPNNKMAISYKLNEVKIFLNGVLVATDTSVTIPATSQVHIGNRNNTDLFIGSYYKSFVLFPTALTNAQLAQLTTL